MTAPASPIDLLRDASSRWGTPLYVTDLDAAAARLAEYRAAFPGALIAYAVKANPDPRLLRRLISDGAGAEVVNAVELDLALRAGCPPARIVMNGVGKTDEDHAAARDAGVLVNAESLEELEALLAIEGLSIGLRLNPALTPDTHAHLATGAADSKFGIAWTDLESALDRCRAAGRRIESVGAHVGSAIDDPRTYALLAERLAEAAGRAGASRVDLGGGAAAGMAIAALAEAVRSHFPDATRLILEPGRSLVADAGWLLTRVVRVQPRPESGITYLVADAGMAEFVRPMLYGAEHPVSLIEPGEPLPANPGTVHLAGPVCEVGDIVAHGIARQLPPADLGLTGTGALLAIGQAGAYGAAMASVYNGRPRPAEAVLEQGEPSLSRRRETVDDLRHRDADATAVAPPQAETERVREGVTMALYIALSLLAVMVALPPNIGSRGTPHPALVVAVAAIGLLLAHMIAFRVSSRLVTGGAMGAAHLRLLAAQLAGGAVVTVVAVVPLLLLELPASLIVSELAVLGLIVVVGYVAARAHAERQWHAVRYVLGIVLLTLVVLWVKSLVLH